MQLIEVPAKTGYVWFRQGIWLFRRNPLAVLVAMICYLPVAMLFWFAPILVAWHDFPPVKALFFSFVICWRNRGAFVIYGVLWIGIAFAVSFGLSALMQVLGAAQEMVLAVLMPAVHPRHDCVVLPVLRDVSRLFRCAIGKFT